MKICIDAGHNYSTYDTGAIGNGLREQDITFSVAEKLKNLLEKAGIEIVMTRPTLATNLGTSVNSSINKRVEISNSNQCNYFISIHCNAGGGTGTETLIYSKGGEAETIAKCVNSSLVSKLQLRDRGVKEQNVGVLRLTNCPAILVECAFIDTPSDANILKNNQNELAEAIYQGLCSDLGIKPNEPTILEMQSFIANKWALSNPNDVWFLLDQHPFKDILYKKMYASYTK